MATLACGPMFIDLDWQTSLVALLVVKPITYFAFIQAFRFRVCSHVPMPYTTAAGIALLRAVIGVFVIGASAIFVLFIGLAGVGPVAWMLLVGERAVVWMLLGRQSAQLHGRRLVGWTISGCAIDVAYDLATLFSLGAGWLPHILAAIASGVFILVLTIVGRRASLRHQFLVGGCTQCGYDLKGNLSGVCPECGTPVPPSTAAYIAT